MVDDLSKIEDRRDSVGRLADDLGERLIGAEMIEARTHARITAAAMEGEHAAVDLLGDQALKLNNEPFGLRARIRRIPAVPDHRDGGANAANLEDRIPVPNAAASRFRAAEEAVLTTPLKKGCLFAAGDADHSWRVPTPLIQAD